MLVPLFGLQMGATAYRPELEGGAKVFSQVVFDLLIHSQVCGAGDGSGGGFMGRVSWCSE